MSSRKRSHTVRSADVDGQPVKRINQEVPPLYPLKNVTRKESVPANQFENNNNNNKNNDNMPTAAVPSITSDNNSNLTNELNATKPDYGMLTAADISAMPIMFADDFGNDDMQCSAPSVTNNFDGQTSINDIQMMHSLNVAPMAVNVQTGVLSSAIGSNPAVNGTNTDTWRQVEIVRKCNSHNDDDQMTQTAF